MSDYDKGSRQQPEDIDAIIVDLKRRTDDPHSDSIAMRILETFKRIILRDKASSFDSQCFFSPLVFVYSD